MLILLLLAHLRGFNSLICLESDPFCPVNSIHPQYFTRYSRDAAIAAYWGPQQPDMDTCAAAVRATQLPPIDPFLLDPNNPPGSFGLGCTTDVSCSGAQGMSTCFYHATDTFCGCSPDETYKYASCSCHGVCRKTHQRCMNVDSADNEWDDLSYDTDQKQAFWYVNQWPKNADFFGPGGYECFQAAYVYKNSGGPVITTCHCAEGYFG